MISWSSWEIDIWTIGWLAFMVFFFVWEFLAIAHDARHTLTFHLRPVFHSAPVTWYIGVGIWLWMGPHFFFPGLEQRFFDLVRS